MTHPLLSLLIATTVLSGDDMLNVEPNARLAVLGHLAVLATIARPLAHELRKSSVHQEPLR